MSCVKLGNAMTFRPIRTAIFPVGGLGTRFLPATKALPKEMLPVVDRPLIQYAVEEARSAGIENIVFVTGRGKSAIEDHFDFAAELETTLGLRGKADILSDLQAIPGSPGAIAYTRQQVPMGLGHAVWTARHLINNEPFAVLLADDLIQAKTPVLKQMVEAYQKVGGNIIAAMAVPEAHTSRYGIVASGSSQDGLTDVKGLVEKPALGQAPSNLAVIGRYILQPVIMDILGRQAAGAGGEIQLTDAIAKMIGSLPVHAYQFDGLRFDCGDKAGHVMANIAFALEREDLRESIKDYIKSLTL
jgi:UTP--glucose-1-phosphate uridylyltransferase